ARKAILWLKKANKGRATFLPLQSIQPRYIHENMLSNIRHQPGFVGIAAELVDADALYEKAINHLMGHVIIAETLQAANKIADITKRRNRIVTLDGDVINPGGAMAGGAKRKG